MTNGFHFDIIHEIPTLGLLKKEEEKSGENASLQSISSFTYQILPNAGVFAAVDAAGP